MYFSKFQRFIDTEIEAISPNLPYIGILAIVGFPVYYFIWSSIFPQPYESLWLRVIGVVFSLPVVFVKAWPESLLQYLSSYIVAVATYVFSFFFNYFYLQNNGSYVSSLSAVAALVMLFASFHDYRVILLIYFNGWLLSLGAFFIAGNSIVLNEQHYQFLMVIIFVLVAGTIFSIRKEYVEKERNNAMRSMGAQIAHELATPLTSIEVKIKTFSRCIDNIIEVYADAQKLGVTSVNKKVARVIPSFKDMLELHESDVRYAKWMTNFLLYNASDSNRVNKKEFSSYSVHKVVKSALDRFPFKEGERAIIKLDIEEFEFFGSDTLFTNVVFNLVKNSLFYLEQKAISDPEIYIFSQENGKTYDLHFKDNGTGIKKDHLSLIFERRYSTKQVGQGTGLGLPFCKMVMESFGGKISCETEVDVYTDIILHFPRSLTV